MPITENDLTKKRLANREIRFGDWHVQKRDDGAEPSGNDTDDSYHIEGRAVVFDSPTVLYPKEYTGLDYDICEVIEKDAFKDCDFSDSVLNINHGDGNHAYAKERAGNLRHEIKDDGVYISADLKKDNRRCEDFYKDVRDGLLDRMSFAFIIKEQSYVYEEHCYHIRSVSKVYDVSAVDHPAYNDTNISAARSADLVKLKEDLVKSERLEQLRSEIRKDIKAALNHGGDR